MNLVFMGTPHFAVPTLEALCRCHEIQAVFCQPDRAVGRGGKMSFPPVKQLALSRNLSVQQPEKLVRTDWESFFKEIAADAYVVVAYGKILPAWLISIPRFGAINLHASLLPRYRGAAPINWAIVHGESRSGLTTMQIDAGMDTGDILLQQEIQIGTDLTAPELHDLLSAQGGGLVLQTLELLEKGRLRPTPQDPALASYAPLLKKEDGRIEWALPALEIYNRIRGLNPWPGTYSFLQGEMLRIWKASPVESFSSGCAPGTLIHDSCSGAVIQCGEGGLQLFEVQPENRKRLSVRDFLNGVRLGPGQSLQLGG
jgi:methionyl-tRNA formyltransferase